MIRKGDKDSWKQCGIIASYWRKNRKMNILNHSFRSELYKMYKHIEKLYYRKTNTFSDE